MQKPLLLASVIFVAVSGNAKATDDYCKNADDAVEFRECGDVYYQMEDKGMTVIYERLIKLLSEQDSEHMVNKISRSENLRESQRAWIKFRDENCEASATALGYGGTIYSDLYQGCMTSMTKERGLELNNLLSLAEGE